MEDSLLYSLLSNELEIAGLRATQGQPGGQPGISRPVAHSKRPHYSDGGRAATARADQKCAGTSYSLELLPAGSGHDDAMHWVVADLSPALAPAAAAPSQRSVLHTRQTSDQQLQQPAHSAAVHRQLVNALKSNSAIRQTALQLLQQSQLQGAQFPPRHGQAQGARQMSLDGSADVYTAAALGATAPDSSTQTQTDLLYAHTGSSSSLPQLGQHQGQHTSPQRGSPQQAFQQAEVTGLFGLRSDIRMPAQQQAAGHHYQDDTEEGVADWAQQLEGELLGCLQGDAHLVATGSFTTMQQRNSSAGLPGFAVQQQQPQQRVHRHFHAPSAPQLQCYQQCYPQQQQQSWVTAPLPAPCAGMHAAPAATSHFQPGALMSLQSLLAVDGDCSPVVDPVGSASSSSNNNSFGMARSGYSSQARASTGQGFHSQPLPALLEQEAQGWGGIKRRNSIDPDQLLANLLHDMSGPVRR